MIITARVSQLRSSVIIVFLLTLLVLRAAEAYALNEPYMVKDMIVDPSASSSPAQFAEINGLLLFAATTLSGTELWKSDGTVEGTVMVKEINALDNCGGMLNEPCSSSPSEFTNVNGSIYFKANNGTNGSELWKSDGTTQGTMLVRDISPGTGSSNLAYLTNVNGVLFFTANDGASGGELWKSDGTVEGTVLVKDVNPGSGSSFPAYLTNVNGVLYFRATDGTNGGELWKSDGTAAGTVLVKDLNPGSAGSIFGSLTNVNGVLYFTANDGTNGIELWKSDGTSAGTVLVKDINPGSGSSVPSNITNVNGVLYFTANDGANGIELWKSDGTAAGTVLVKDINPGSGNSVPSTSNITNVNGVLYFSATDGTNGFELWKSDGTTAGTVLVKDINPGAGNSSPANITNVNGVLYFSATDGTNGIELWKSDGTAAGTVLVKDVNPGSGSSFPAYLTNVNGVLYFAATDPTNGAELWKSDGTTAGTVLVKDIRNTGNLSPNSLTDVAGTLFFVANDGTNGVELWKSDGTAAGTVLVKDINPGAGNSSPANITNLNGASYFAATDGTNGSELWKSDGTTAGTVLVKDINPGAGNSSPSNITNVNGVLYFAATDGTNGIELWKSDGTAAGTVLVKDIIPGSGNSSPANITNVNGVLYFAATDGTNGIELWKSDGTTAGTVLVKDINPGSGNSSPANITNVNGVLYLSANDGTNGPELWKSDGTAAGTVLVKDISPGSAGSISGPLTNVNGVLYFTADDGTTGVELWKSDGTAAGTVLVKDIWPGYCGTVFSLLCHSSPEELTNVNGVLFFIANDGTNGSGLWKSDGTTAGTVRIGRADKYLKNVNGVLYFRAYDNTNGNELWKSDGTTEGTMLVKDLCSGPCNSDPAYLAIANWVLYFSADDGISGAELWAIDLETTSPSPPGTPTDAGAFSNSTTVNFIWTAATDPESGVAGYTLQVGTSPGGSNVFNGSVGNVLTYSVAATDGQTLYARVQAVNGAGMTSAWSGNSDGITIDTSPPSAPGTPTDAGIFSTSPALFSWSTATDVQSGINGYNLQVGTTPGGSNIFNGSVGNVLSMNVAGANGQTLYARVQAINNLALVGTWSGSSDGITIDTIAPVTSATPTGGNYSTAQSVTLSCSDSAGSGCANTYYCQGAGCTPATAYSTAVTMSRTGTLRFFSVDVAGNSEPVKTETYTIPDKLAVTKIGIGGGTVTSSPAGIACGGTCSYVFNSGDVVTLTAMPDDGSFFNGWSGDADCADGVITMNGPKACTAVFTHAIKDINPGAGGSDPANMAAASLSGMLYFASTDPVNGTELWRSDGTTAGTMLVMDINPGPESSYPSNFVVIGAALYFTADDSIHGVELWKSDGAGTVMVKDITPGLNGAGPQYISKTGTGTVYFAADDGISGYELWKSNGTEAGTVQVKDMNPGAVGSNPALFTNVSGTLYFAASDGTHGGELWKSDGTEAGTVIVKDIAPGMTDTALYDLTSVNGVLYFTAEIGEMGRNIWKSDGTEAGTVQVSSGILLPYGLTNVNGTVFFSAYDASIGYGGHELWKTDGTGAGTVLVKDINPGTTASFPQNLTNVNGVAHFSADDGTHGNELWKSDGTAEGTVLVKDINPSGSSNPQNLTNVNGVLYFTANDGTHGIEFWKSDGTAAGTVMVEDINPGSGGSDPQWFTRMNGRLFFSATDGSVGRELYAVVTDVSGPSAPGVPAAGSAYSAASDAAFFWTAATDPESGIKGYNIQAGTSPGGNDVYDLQVVNTLSLNVPGTDGQTLYMRVQAVNGVGIAGPWSESSAGVTIDMTRPTTQVSAPSETWTATGPVTYTVTYSDANFDISTLSAENVILRKTGTADGAVSVDSGTGTVRTVTISSITGDGTLGIRIPQGTALDLAGNIALSTVPSATFTVVNTIVQYNLTVTRLGNGTVMSNTGGISCGTTCEASYTSGTPVNFTVILDAGWNFVGWSGACTGLGTCNITMDADKTVMARFVAPAKIGVFTNGYWYLDANQSWDWNGTPTDILGTFGIGLPGAIPVVGDWNGDGKTEIGIYVNGEWYLDMNNNWQWDGEGIDVHGVFGAGLPNPIPVVGDWNGDGKTEIGIYSDGNWYLDTNQSWAWEGAPADTYGVFGTGLSNPVPVTGDWNGDGITEIGIYSNGNWYLDKNQSWAWEGEPADTYGVFGSGLANPVPVTGDWDGSGITKIGIFSEGNWYLDTNASWQWEGTPTDTFGVFGLGLGTVVPVTGNW